MKKIFLLSALLIFACSSDDSTSDDNSQNNSIIIDGSESPLSTVLIYPNETNQTIKVFFYDICYLYNSSYDDLSGGDSPIPYFQVEIGSYNAGFLASGTYQMFSPSREPYVGEAFPEINIYAYDNEADVESNIIYPFEALHVTNDGVFNVERISSNNYSFSWDYVAKLDPEDTDIGTPFNDDYPVVSGSYSGEVILLDQSPFFYEVGGIEGGIELFCD